MREIKFRGKRVDNGEWAVSQCHLGTMHSGTVIHDFYQETVGQFTGMADKNCMDIYEGDIVRIKVPRIDGTFNEGIFKCEYYEGSFWFLCNDDDKFYQGGSYGYSDTMYKNIEVIGNVWDNPELLEVME